MTTFSIKTLGCKVNQFESETLEQALVNQGYLPAGEDEADLCIINTCTVTQKASMQSRQAIRQVIRANPGARILVTGCYAQTEPEAIRGIAGVHDIIGHEEKSRIPEKVFLTEAPTHRSTGKPTHPSPGASALFDFSLQRSQGRTRPFLKIQDGCNAFCAYCIVPYARGRSRSLPVESVLESIRGLKADGIHEIVLTGIHIGHYGLDLKPETCLTDLLAALENAGLMERVRISSIEPTEVSDALIEMVAGSRVFCHHFHIPLQSGDNDVLKRMNRPYTREMFYDLVCKIHDRIPDAAIGADILVGFPGESDAAFDQTVSLIEALPITYLHVFPFSPRKGTPAYGFSDQISHAIVKARCSALRALGRAKKKCFYRSHIGKEVEILIEGARDDATGLLKGLTSNYIPVMVEGQDHLRNTLTKARIIRMQGETAMFGEIQCVS
ncbi:MAG: tRNA (N(6)-L-threonylcarbamoyladenosine(37)-C(2))-methylthiotransferase MtaB [Deltaproteobacteria bacterium]|nr:tRNA (N(6)-L-threonylcarbamoyladenosine(37)-C(2))-methylthiotransferase MtaB [Deltaproteobacteria bacterium]